MKIEYLFSRNNKIGSRAISWAARYEETGLEKNPSHIAVLVNDDLIIESTFSSGVRIIPYLNWSLINEELYRIPCQYEYRHSKEITELISKFWGKKYDWKGIMFFTWRYLGLILFKRPLPSKNQWERESHYFCTEFVGSLVGQNFSMKSPARICADWLKELS